MEEPVELPGVKLRKTIAFGLRQTAAGQHDAVVLIAAHDEAACAIDHRGLRWIVVCGQELGEAVPAAVPGRPDGMPHAILQCQFLGDFPAILHVPIECRCHPRRDRLAAEFRIIVEVPE